MRCSVLVIAYSADDRSFTNSRPWSVMRVSGQPILHMTCTATCTRQESEMCAHVMYNGLLYTWPSTHTEKINLATPSAVLSAKGAASAHLEK